MRQKRTDLDKRIPEPNNGNIANIAGPLDPAKAFELLNGIKVETHKKRDGINNIYVSICAFLATVMPFLNNFTKDLHTAGQVNYLILLIPLTGAIITLSWISALGRMNRVLQNVTKQILKLEKASRLNLYTDVYNAMRDDGIDFDNLTKQEMVIPYVFLANFVAILAVFIMREGGLMNVINIAW